MAAADSPLQTKINRHAFSGGQANLEDHRRLGGNPDVDVSYIYLTYFEEDDAKLEKLAKDYRSGELLTGDLKKLAIDILQEYVEKFQARRAQVTDEILESYMKPRKLHWGGNPLPIRPKEEPKDAAAGGKKKGDKKEKKKAEKKPKEEGGKPSEAKEEKKEEAAPAAAPAAAEPSA
jgi:tryptophanyl-tRNA synthetase